MEPDGTVRDSQTPLETVRKSKQLHRTGIDNERQPATKRDGERHAVNPWLCERQ